MKIVIDKLGREYGQWLDGVIRDQLVPAAYANPAVAIGWVRRHVSRHITPQGMYLLVDGCIVGFACQAIIVNDDGIITQRMTYTPTQERT